MIVKCQQCEAVIDVKESVSKDFKYTCKKHNIEPVENRVGIETCQFDPRLKGGYYKAPHGYQILSPDQEDIFIPEWTKSNAEIQRVICSAFPRFETNERQQFFARRWAAVIYLFWRLRYSEGDIADELRVSVETVNWIIAAAKRVSQGKRTDGQERSASKSGRPKKRKSTFKLS